MSREGQSVLVGLPVLAALAGGGYLIGHAVIPELPWFLAVILGVVFVFGGFICLVAVLALAMGVGEKVLQFFGSKPPWDGGGAPDGL